MWGFLKCMYSRCVANCGNAPSAVCLYDTVCPIFISEKFCLSGTIQDCLFPFFVLFLQLLSACCIPVSTATWESRTSSRGSGRASWGVSLCSSVSTTPVLYPFTMSCTPLKCTFATFVIVCYSTVEKYTSNWLNFGCCLHQLSNLLYPFAKRGGATCWWPNICVRNNQMLSSCCLICLSLTSRNTETRLRQQRAALLNASGLVPGSVVDIRPVQERLRTGHHHCLFSYCDHTAAGLQWSLPVSSPSATTGCSRKAFKSGTKTFLSIFFWGNKTNAVICHHYSFISYYTHN